MLLAYASVQHQPRCKYMVEVQPERIGVLELVPEGCHRNRQTVRRAELMRMLIAEIEGQLRLVAEILIDLETGDILRFGVGVNLHPIVEIPRTGGGRKQC